MLEELPKGHSSFIPVSVGALGFPGNVQYDGKYMTIGDQSTNAIYRSQCIAANCMLRGVVSLDGAMACGQTWIAIGIVFCSDGGAGNVKVYKYPCGRLAHCDVREKPWFHRRCRRQVNTLCRGRLGPR